MNAKTREPNLWPIINMLPQFTNVVQQPPNMVQHAIIIIPLAMVAPIENVLKIQICQMLYFHGDDLVSLLCQLPKVFVINGKLFDAHKL